MKKIICVLFVLIMSFNVYAGSGISIDSITQQGDKIIFDGSVTDFEKGDIVNVMVTEYVNDNYDLNTVTYIDAFEITDGRFNSEFYLSDSAQRNKSYILRVGATNVENPTYGIFVYKDNQMEILYGDVDLDGVLTSSDAATVLQYVNNTDSIDFSELQLKAANVTGDDFLSAGDAAQILAKVLNSDYKFLVEE